MTHKNYTLKEYTGYFFSKLKSFVKSYFSFFSRKSERFIPLKVKNRFSKGIVSIVSGSLFAFIFTVFIAPVVCLFVYDAFAFNLADKQATYVFSKANEVGGKSEQYRVFACKKMPCRAQVDSVEFRIRDSVYMDVVWLLTKFEPYDQGELAGAFLSEQNNCTIRYYGRRFKYFGVYPKIIDANCSPVNQ